MLLGRKNLIFEGVKRTVRVDVSRVGASINSWPDDKIHCMLKMVMENNQVQTPWYSIPSHDVTFELLSVEK